MAGPWEKYQTAPAAAPAPAGAPSNGPWSQYAVPQDAPSDAVPGRTDTGIGRLISGEPQPVNSAPGWANALNSFGEGVVNAATFGFGDELGAAADYAGSHILPWRDPKTYDQALADTRGEAKQTAADHPIANIAGNVTGAVGAGTGLARAGLSLTSRAANAGRGLLATSAASAADGGLAGALQGFGQGEGGFLNRLRGARDSGFTGALVGAALPGAVSAVTNGVRRVISPFTSSPERQALVNTLANEGVDVTAGQAMGSPGLRYAEGEIGGQAAQNIADRQGEQFTSAVLRRAGINANRATPDVIDDAFDQLGQRFGQLAARNNLVPDGQLSTELGDALRGYQAMVPPSARAPIVENTLRDINDVAQRGPIDGAAYQAVRSRLERAARGTADPELQQALRGIRTALDDGMERSIAANNPADLGAWQNARDHYRNMLVIERAATGAGENAAQGLISPSALRTATVVSGGRRNYARGIGDFAELARAGEGVMKPLPNSGTAGRLRAQNLGTTFLGALGGIAGTVHGGPEVGVAAATAGAAIPRIVGNMMMTTTGQRYLRNQLLSGNLPAQTRAGIVNAINQIDANALPRLIGQDGF